jgi:hypothetical protein
MVKTGLAQAETLAWPLADIQAFRAKDDYLHGPDIKHTLDKRLRALGLPDHAEDLATLVWSRQPEMHLDVYLKRQASKILEPCGNVCRLKPDHLVPGEEILRWRWISLALPPDLLIAAADLEGVSARVQVLDPTLRVLEPVAHLHVHATAAVSYSDIWPEMGRTMDFRKVKTAPEGFSSVEEWRAWLRRAFAARHVLDIWMRSGKEAALTYVHQNPALNQALLDLERGTRKSTPLPMETDIGMTVKRYSYLHRFHRGDIRQKPEIDSEVFFLRRCLRYLECCDEDVLFRRIWTQMTRIRVQHYRHMVHDPAKPGLDAFAKLFEHISEYSSERLDQLAIDRIHLDRGLDIAHVELRKAPGGLSKMAKLHNQANTKSSKNTKSSTISWILHFIRDMDSKQGLKGLLRSHYGSAWLLAAVFRVRPEYLGTIRALDVASRELSGPLWAAAGALHHVREESRRIAGESSGLHPLGLTVHAGEDFRHILSGLRAVHEPFWWGLMRRGDRLGHALALGWQPIDWCDAHPEIVQPQFERMLDLAWLLDFIAIRRISKVSVGFLESARQELQGYLLQWNIGADISHFLQVVKQLGRPGFWQNIDGPYLNVPEGYGNKFWKITAKLLDKYDGHMANMVTVRTEPEAETLVAVRDELARLLAYWRTPIEVNPSSNLFIGNFKYPLAQPLFYLDPYDRAEDRGLVLTLSADDPISFASTLADEFAYAWAGLVIGGKESPAYAQEWLERAAKSSRRSVF